MGGLRALPESSFGLAAGALLLAVSKLVPPVWVHVPTAVRAWSDDSLRGCIPPGGGYFGLRLSRPEVVIVH